MRALLVARARALYELVIEPVALMLKWMWSHLAVAWDEWHMARLDHRACPSEWSHRIRRAARWRAIRDGSLRSY
jgi:hypothetical protein